jgi:type VI secretion system protein ImpF
MPKELERTVRLSVLDRLIDHDTRHSGEAPPTWSESVGQLKEALRRDVEWLLNTRRTIEPVTSGVFAEVQRSVYGFGLPDVTSLSSDSEHARQRLLRSIEESFQLFEPRLTNVRVYQPEGKDKADRRIRFVIEGLLRMEPNPERIAFDTELDTCTGNILIRSTDA